MQPIYVVRRLVIQAPGCDTWSRHCSSAADAARSGVFDHPSSQISNQR